MQIILGCTPYTVKWTFNQEILFFHNPSPQRDLCLSERNISFQNSVLGAPEGQWMVQGAEWSMEHPCFKYMKNLS